METLNATVTGDMKSYSQTQMGRAGRQQKPIFDRVNINDEDDCYSVRVGTGEGQLTISCELIWNSWMSQSPLNLPLYLSVCLSCVAIGFLVKGDNNNEPEEEEEEAVRHGAIMSIGE